MTFEEFETAKIQDLKRHAKKCFDECQTTFMTGDTRAAVLLEAQFYMSEIDRRHDSWISLRDLLLEIVVIALIGGEIGLAVEASRDEDKLMDKQNAVLEHLKDSSSATAATLQSLQLTTENMDRAAQRQLSIASAISVSIALDQPNKRIQIINGSNGTIELWGINLGAEAPKFESSPTFIARGEHYYIASEILYDSGPMHGN